MSTALTRRRPVYFDAMLTVVIDSHVMDVIADLTGAYEASLQAVREGRVEILFTHVNVDELCQIPDLERRGRLLILLISIGRLVPTGAMVLGFSRLDFTRLTKDGEAFDAFTQGNIKRCRDALIASTAIAENCALVTADKKLIGRARERGIRVLGPMELLEEIGFKTVGLLWFKMKEAQAGYCQVSQAEP